MKPLFGICLLSFTLLTLSCRDDVNEPGAPPEQKKQANLPSDASGSACHGEFISFIGFEDLNGGIERGIVELRWTIWCNPGIIYGYYIEFKNPQSTTWRTLDTFIYPLTHSDPYEYRFRFDAHALFEEIGNEGICEFRIKEVFLSGDQLYTPPIQFLVHPI